jgi:hypothetical protein
MNKETIEKKFNEFCILTKDGGCKYWNPESFGYKKGDMECSMDKFFPETIKQFIFKSIQEVLEDYNKFLLKNNYIDADVYAEEPTAIERFLDEYK